MKKEPIDDLRLLSLRFIAEETPGVATILFNYGFNYGRGSSPERAAGEWMEYYGVSADWLETFLRSVPGQEQEQKLGLPWLSASHFGHRIIILLCFLLRHIKAESSSVLCKRLGEVWQLEPRLIV